MAISILRQATSKRGDDFRRRYDRLCICTKCARKIAIVTRNAIRLESLGCHGHEFAVAAHDTIVHDDCRDGDLNSYGGFDIGCDHAEGRVSHDVESVPIRSCELRSQSQAETGPKLS
jgi:hypothetical protein